MQSIIATQVLDFLTKHPSIHECIVYCIQPWHRYTATYPQLRNTAAGAPTRNTLHRDLQQTQSDPNPLRASIGLMSAPLAV
jgi:hypothetical protein